MTSRGTDGKINIVGSRKQNNYFGRKSTYRARPNRRYRRVCVFFFFLYKIPKKSNETVLTIVFRYTWVSR